MQKIIYDICFSHPWLAAKHEEWLCEKLFDPEDFVVCKSSELRFRIAEKRSAFLRCNTSAELAPITVPSNSRACLRHCVMLPDQTQKRIKTRPVRKKRPAR